MPRPTRPLAMLAPLLVVAGVGVRAESPGGSAPPAPVSKAADAASPVVTEIVVTGSRPAVENRIDRRVYAVSGDLHGDIGSAADVLRNIPSVSVDLEGNPSLRGDDDVQILIDGRYRPEFNGASKGAALEALAAQGIDRIEVMTNPPANFKREGSAGIINIITKRSTRSRTASLQTGVGSNGRWNVGGNAGLQLGDLSLRGSASVRHDLRVRHITGRRTVRDADGAVLNEREQRTDTEDDRVNKKVSLGADYDLSDEDRLSADASFYRRDSQGVLNDGVRLQDGNGTVLSQYSRERRARDYEHNSDAMLRYRHAGDGEDDGLTLSLEHAEDVDHPDWDFRYSYSVPSQPDLIQFQRPFEREVSTELTIDYAASASDERRFTTGYDFEVDELTSDFSMSIPVAPGGVEIPDPALTNRFRGEQRVHAVYATYEQPFGDWTALAGVRLEQAGVDLHQVTSGDRGGQDYFRAYPSLHVSRKLDERQTLTFSYARRVRRAFVQAMNPYVVQIDPNHFRAGNPDLKPSEIDSLELAWNYDVGATSFGASVYGRRRYDVFTYVQTLISPTVELETPENLGDNRSGGLELTASGKSGSRFSYNLSANAFYDEIDATNLGFAGTRSTITYDGKAALNWRLGEKDRVQINVAAMGRRLTPQGYRLGSATMDLGYRHQLDSALSFTATLTDVFASKVDRVSLDSPDLTERSEMQPQGRIWWVGLTWTMASGKEKPAEKFEYEN